MGDAAALLAGAARRDPEAWAAPLPARLARRRSASMALATLAAEAGETDPRFSFEDGERDREPDFWPEDLAGGPLAMKIITTASDDRVATDIDFETESHRRCGGCTLCCKLLPIAQFESPAGKPCPHQRTGKGCAIYQRRPLECQTWSCRWLAAEDETAGMKRPDRVHYCIDPFLDEMRLVPPDGGEPFVYMCLQVWIDPAFPAAARDPELRAYLARMAERYGVAAILRWSNRRATAVFPPALNANGQWHEETSNLTTDPTVGLFGRLPRAIQNRLG